MKYNYDYKYLLSVKGIYQIRQLSTNKLYIGSTANNFYDRMCAHNSVLKRNKHSSIYLQRAWNKYGADDFQFEILEILDDITDILLVECNYIRDLQTNNSEFGFNVAKEVSPNRLGHYQSTETRRKISEKLKGITRSPETRKKMGLAKAGENSPAWGKKQSDELIKKRLRNNKTKVLRSDGKEYDSLLAAAADLNCLYQSISQSLRKGHKCKGYYFYYLELSNG